jgi:hypothetical protein
MADPPVVDTLEAKKQLTQAAFTDEQADGPVQFIKLWSKHMATKEDLHQQKQEIKEELRHEMRRMRRQITLANAATMAALLALFEFAA